MSRGESAAAADDGGDRPLEEAVAGAVTALTFLVGFGLLFADVAFFWVAFPVGFAGVLPMALGLVKLYRRRTEGATEDARETETALDELRDRYARGELSEAEFERRVERLLETESVDDARDSVERARPGGSSGRRQHGRETEHEREYERGPE